MAEIHIDINESPVPKNPVAPKMYNGDHVIQFRCHKQVACFNACCKDIDISLTPYDILRLKRRLGVSSSEFLRAYTVPYEMEQGGIAGVKLLPVEDSTVCRFMTDEGCSVYEDRPTACRYYPVALLSMRRQDEYVDRQAYALVTEDHCLGHREDRTLTIDQYRAEQGLDEYDELARGWRQLVLKKKSSGPTIGKPSQRSRHLFFMASYDVDSFRVFVNSGPFRDSLDLPEDEIEAILADDVKLMTFGFDLLKQVLFGEKTIPLKGDAVEARQELLKVKQQRLEEEARQKREAEDPYNAECNPDGCGAEG